MAKSARLLAIAESLVVTAIWASSFVFVKYALKALGPLTVAGLRYSLAFVVLLPFLTFDRKPAQPLPARVWLRLTLIGLCGYTFGSGALFWGLKYLPATTGSFLMSLIPLLVLVASIFWLREMPTMVQLAGVVIGLAGGFIFFSPGLRPGEPVGIAILSVGLLAFSVFAILGREIARDRQVTSLFLTAIPLAIGGGFSLLVAFAIEGLPAWSLPAAGVVLWLAIVNTAFANTLYNHALQHLRALEMNMILNLAPLGTALLAWLLLDERLSLIQIGGMVIVVVGVVLVQRRREKVVS